MEEMEMDDYFEAYSVPDDYEESRSTWENSSNIEPEEIITNDKGETFIISEEKREEYKNQLNIKFAEDFFVNILELDEIYTDRFFIDHLLDTNTLSIERNLSDTGLISDYTLKYYGGEFKSMTLKEMNLLRNSIMDDYDNYNRQIRNRKIKKGGIITAIGLTIIGLITGLSVGLTRKGNDLVHKSKWEKLKPSEPVKHIIPWTDLRDASGKILVFTGRYLTVILIGTLGYLLIKKKRTKR